MRVLYFSRGYTPHDHRFLAALARTGNEIHFLPAFDGARRNEARPLPDGVRVHQALSTKGERPLWALPADVPRLRMLLADIRPDLVHAGPIQIGALLTALARFRPLVAMSWGSDLLRDGARGIGRLAAGYALRRCEALVCDCQAVRAVALKLGVPGERIVVFPWGVDLAHFNPVQPSALRARLGWEGELVLLSTRSWEPGYGIEVLVGGFIRAARSLPELRLLMLGDGSLRPRILRLLVEAGMENRVHSAGQVGWEDLPSCYRAADLYVSASRSDGSSVSLLEAMACGLPALVSDIPGNREWIRPGIEGWLFRDGDEADLACAIGRAAKGRGDLKQAGAHARGTAEQRADWGRNFPLLLEAYQIALGEDRRQ
jgi:glycosyltransferase involved in cell wall biosynthesis